MHPRVPALSIAGVLLLILAAPGTAQSPVGKPSLYLIGDSTVKVGTLGQVGWGERIADYFDPARISVVNAARGGRSSRTYLTEGLWDRVLVDLKRGDFVIMQFGHNDGAALFTTDRPRGSIKGTGEDSQSGTVEMTGTPEVVHTFGWYLRRFIADARAKDATPIVCSLIPRNVWKDGKVVRDPYAAWARDVAAAADVAFIDLNEITARRYEEMGADNVLPLFPNDHTHTNAAGADINAASVIAGLKGLGDCPLCADLSPKAGAVPRWPPR